MVWVSYSTTSLGVGVSNAILTVAAWDGYGGWGTTNTVAVRMEVRPAVVLGCDGVDVGVTNRQGQTPGATTFGVWNDSAAPRGGLTWRVSADVPWLTVSPSLGQSTGERDGVTVRYGTGGLRPGMYRGVITVSGED